VRCNVGQHTAGKKRPRLVERNEKTEERRSDEAEQGDANAQHGGIPALNAQQCRSDLGSEESTLAAIIAALQVVASVALSQKCDTSPTTPATKSPT
jgi:hypothetical protein